MFYQRLYFYEVPVGRYRFKIYTNFNLSIRVSKLRGIAQYMPEYDLRDLLNKNQTLARNSKGASFKKNKQDFLKQSKHTLGIYI